MTSRNTVLNLIQNRAILFFIASASLLIGGAVISLVLGVGAVDGIGYKYVAVGCITTGIVVQFIALIDLLITGECHE